MQSLVKIFPLPAEKLRQQFFAKNLSCDLDHVTSETCSTHLPYLAIYRAEFGYNRPTGCENIAVETFHGRQTDRRTEPYQECESPHSRRFALKNVK